MNKYDKLIEFLRANDFICELVSFNSNALHYTIWNKSKTVVGLLSTKDSTVDKSNRYNDSILFDNYEAFNKWSQAPIQLEIVGSDEYRDNLLKELEFLGSNEGYKLSNEFDYEMRFMKEYERVEE